MTSYVLASTDRVIVVEFSGLTDWVHSDESEVEMQITATVSLLENACFGGAMKTA